MREDITIVSIHVQNKNPMDAAKYIKTIISELKKEYGDNHTLHLEINEITIDG